MLATLDKQRRETRISRKHENNFNLILLVVSNYKISYNYYIEFHFWLRQMFSTDVVLLTDVFETFINRYHEIYKLGLAWFYSSPGIVWQAAIRLTNIRLDQITDLDIYLFAEDEIRGGASSEKQGHACSITKKGLESRVKGLNCGFLPLIFFSFKFGHLECFTPLKGMCFWSLHSVRLRHAISG